MKWLCQRKMDLDWETISLPSDKARKQPCHSSIHTTHLPSAATSLLWNRFLKVLQMSDIRNHKAFVHHLKFTSEAVKPLISVAIFSFNWWSKFFMSLPVRWLNFQCGTQKLTELLMWFDLIDWIKRLMGCQVIDWARLILWKYQSVASCMSCLGLEEISSKTKGYQFPCKLFWYDMKKRRRKKTT